MPISRKTGRYTKGKHALAKERLRTRERELERETCISTESKADVATYIHARIELCGSSRFFHCIPTLIAPDARVSSEFIFFFSFFSCVCGGVGADTIFPPLDRLARETGPTIYTDGNESDRPRDLGGRKKKEGEKEREKRRVTLTRGVDEWERIGGIPPNRRSLSRLIRARIIARVTRRATRSRVLDK